MNSAIEGLEIFELKVHEDERGALYEMYRNEWTSIPAFLQWNLVYSNANSLRGVHVHPRHSDYLHVIQGQMLLGLHDLRPNDENYRSTEFLLIDGEHPKTVLIPPGVCHGFYFPLKTSYIYGLSTGWSMNEELGCRYDDPSLKMDWPCKDPILSIRDTYPQMNYNEMRLAWIQHSSRKL